MSAASASTPVELWPSATNTTDRTRASGADGTGGRLNRIDHEVVRPLRPPLPELSNRDPDGGPKHPKIIGYDQAART